MPETQADVLIRIGALLARELDVQSDGGSAAVEGSLVRRLHHARPAAGDDRKAGVGQ